MKFFAVAAAFVAAVAASGYEAAETCSAVTVTSTVTLPYGTAPSAPASASSALPPYPTGSAPYPSAPAPSGTGVVPSAPAPSGTGAYSAPPSYFTGAASSNQAIGMVAGVGAFAAMFL